MPWLVANGLLPGRGPPPPEDSGRREPPRPPPRPIPWVELKGLLPGRGVPPLAARGPGRGPGRGAGVGRVPCGAAGDFGADLAGLADLSAAAGLDVFSEALAAGAAGLAAAVAGLASVFFAAAFLAGAGLSSAFLAVDFLAAGLAAESFLAPDFSSGFFTSGAGNASRSLRTTGASMVEDGDLTNSPRSLSLASTTLLSTSSSRASS